MSQRTNNPACDKKVKLYKWSDVSSEYEIDTRWRAEEYLVRSSKINGISTVYMWKEFCRLNAEKSGGKRIFVYRRDERFDTPKYQYNTAHRRRK